MKIQQPNVEVSLPNDLDIWQASSWLTTRSLCNIGQVNPLSTVALIVIRLRNRDITYILEICHLTEKTNWQLSSPDIS